MGAGQNEGSEPRGVSFDPMTEAGGPHTSGVARGHVWSNHCRFCATLQGQKAKAALQEEEKSAAKDIKKAGAPLDSFG